MAKKAVSLVDFMDWKGFRNAKYATDAQGHSTRVNFRIQGATVRMVQEFVQEYGEEYKEPGDFYRHAVRNHCEALSKFRQVKNKDRITSTMRQVDAMLDILQYEDELANFDHVIQRAQDVISKMMTKGAHSEVARTISDLRTEVNQITSPFWRKHYLKELRNRFGSYEKSMKGTSLTKTKAGD